MLKKLIFIFAFFLFSAASVFACDCSPPGSARAAFNNSAIVMVIKFESIERWPESTNPDFIRGLNFTVEKVYKGDMKPGDAGLYANNKRAPANPSLFMSSSCDKRFGKENLGKRILFYGHKPKAGEDWVAFSCSRTGHLDERAGDIIWLDKMDEVAGKTRISGRAAQYVPGTGYTPPQGIADASVTITGDGKTHTLQTDENGIFEIYGLAPGTYSIRVEPREQLELVWARPFADSDPKVKLTGDEKRQRWDTLRAIDNKNLSAAPDAPRQIILHPGGHSGLDFYFKEKK